MSDPPKTAIIIGGSLSALLAAVALRHLNHAVHILERSAPQALQSQAAGIRIGPEVYAFISRYMPHHPQDYHLTPEKVEIVNDEGKVERELETREPLRLTTWKVVYDMLRDCLLDGRGAGPRATYRTLHEVRDVMEGDDGRVSVRYHDIANGTDEILEAEVVIAADGANSFVRQNFLPEISPKYAGYVSWRGRVPESALSDTMREVLRNRCVIHRVEEGYQISYYVPTEATTNHAGQRDFVFVWYDNLPEDSPEFQETMTDINGIRHRSTVPRGKMQPQVWKRLLARNARSGNYAFGELIEKIEEPFVSAIHDFQGEKAVFLGGKLLLVGDAFNLCRPHGGGSTNLAAFQVQELVKCWGGEMSLMEWEKRCVESTAKAAEFSLKMAQFFWHG